MVRRAGDLNLVIAWSQQNLLLYMPFLTICYDPSYGSVPNHSSNCQIWLYPNVSAGTEPRYNLPEHVETDDGQTEAESATRMTCARNTCWIFGEQTCRQGSKMRQARRQGHCISLHHLSQITKQKVIDNTTSDLLATTSTGTAPTLAVNPASFWHHIQPSCLSLLLQSARRKAYPTCMGIGQARTKVQSET